MTRPSLKSRFGEQIRAFVGYKNSLGFPYDESIRILGRFDDFCVERFPEKDCLDRELALAWLEKRDTENTAGHRNRIMVIREFAKYLRAVGTEAYMIPISMTSKGPRYVPHIFNEAEIKAFFHGADSFRPHEKAPARHLVIPVFYRLLYLHGTSAHPFRNGYIPTCCGTHGQCTYTKTVFHWLWYPNSSAMRRLKQQKFMPMLIQK